MFYLVCSVYKDKAGNKVYWKITTLGLNLQNSKEIRRKVRWTRDSINGVGLFGGGGICISTP